MINHKKLIKEREKVVTILREKANEVAKIPFKNSVTVTINIKDLPQFKEEKKVGDLYYKDKHKPDIKRAINVKDGAVYIFHLPKAKKANIKKALKAYKDKKVRVAPSLENTDKREEKADVLYIGSINQDFGNRFCQHLGYGTPKTGALQLIHWSNRLFTTIKMTYYVIKPSRLALARQAEIILCNTHTPLIGRMEKDTVNVKGKKKGEHS